MLCSLRLYMYYVIYIHWQCILLISLNYLPIYNSLEWEMLCNIHRTLYTIRSTQYGLHNTVNTIRSTQYGLHNTVNTIRSTQYGLHNTVYTIRSTQYGQHNTVNTIRSTLYTAMFIIVIILTAFDFNCTVLFIKGIMV